MKLLALTLMLVLTPLNADAVAPKQEPLVHHWKACQGEEAFNAPCVWDARHMGNGLGHSFKALPTDDREHPRIIRISHRKAHRLAGL